MKEKFDNFINILAEEIYNMFGGSIIKIRLTSSILMLINVPINILINSPFLSAIVCLCILLLLLAYYKNETVIANKKMAKIIIIIWVFYFLSDIIEIFL